MRDGGAVTNNAQWGGVYTPNVLELAGPRVQFLFIICFFSRYSQPTKVTSGKWRGASIKPEKKKAEGIDELEKTRKRSGPGRSQVEFAHGSLYRVCRYCISDADINVPQHAACMAQF